MEHGTEKYINSVKYLSSLYDFLNGQFFNGALDKPVITIQQDSSNKAFGWFSIKKVWKETDNDEGQNEINLSAQFLNRPIRQIAATLLHEMCHQWAQANNLQDCSRSGSYHNKIFKRIAETHGLTVEFVKTLGYAHTELNATSETIIEKYVSDNPPAIIYRLPVFKGQSVKSTSTRKYVCGCCGNSVRATKRVNLICGDCNCPMVEE